MARLKQPTRAVCEHCGAEFDRWYTNQRFCTKECQADYKNNVYMPEYNRRYRAEHGDAIRAMARAKYAQHREIIRRKKAALKRLREVAPC